MCRALAVHVKEIRLLFAHAVAIDWIIIITQGYLNSRYIVVLSGYVLLLGMPNLVCEIYLSRLNALYC